MKRTHLFVLGLIVATCAVGCGTENPTGPSFARTSPTMETQVSAVPVEGEEPLTVGDDISTTMPDADPATRDGKKAKNPNWKRGQDTAPGQQEAPAPDDPIERN